MNSVYDKVISKQPICNVLLKVIATIYSDHLFFIFKSSQGEELEHWRQSKPLSQAKNKIGTVSCWT